MPTERQHNTDRNKYTDIGVKGRRTGVTAKKNVLLDDDGLENISAFMGDDDEEMHGEEDKEDDIQNRFEILDELPGSGKKQHPSTVTSRASTSSILRTSKRTSPTRYIRSNRNDDTTITPLMTLSLPLGDDLDEEEEPMSPEITSIAKKLDFSSVQREDEEEQTEEEEGGPSTPKAKIVSRKKKGLMLQRNRAQANEKRAEDNPEEGSSLNRTNKRSSMSATKTNAANLAKKPHLTNQPHSPRSPRTITTPSTNSRGSRRDLNSAQSPEKSVSPQNTKSRGVSVSSPKSILRSNKGKNTPSIAISSEIQSPRSAQRQVHIEDEELDDDYNDVSFDGMQSDNAVSYDEDEGMVRENERLISNRRTSTGTMSTRKTPAIPKKPSPTQAKNTLITKKGKQSKPTTKEKQVQKEEQLKWEQAEERDEFRDPFESPLLSDDTELDENENEQEDDDESYEEVAIQPKKGHSPKKAVAASRGNSTKAIKSKGKASLQKKTKQEETTIPEQTHENDTHVRRSNRQRITPLDFWKGEKVIYGRRQSGHSVVPVIKEVIRIPGDDEDNHEKITKRKKTTKNGGANKKLKQEGFRREMNPIAPVWQIAEDGNKIETDRRIAFTPSMLSPNTVLNSNYKFQKIFSEGKHFSTGIVVIPKGEEKPAKTSHNSSVAYFVIDGEVEATVHKTTFKLYSGDQFYVPIGNRYQIVNTGNTEVQLFFAQGQRKDPLDNDQ